MSDFGTMVLVGRQDGAKQTAADFVRLGEATHAVQNTGEHSDALSQPFLFRVSGSPEMGPAQVPVVLSEYWGEGIEEGDYGDRTAEQIVDADRPAAQAARDALAARLGADYTTELICGTW